MQAKAKKKILTALKVVAAVLIVLGADHLLPANAAVLPKVVALVEAYVESLPVDATPDASTPFAYDGGFDGGLDGGS